VELAGATVGRAATTAVPSAKSLHTVATRSRDFNLTAPSNPTCLSMWVACIADRTRSGQDDRQPRTYVPQIGQVTADPLDPVFLTLEEVLQLHDDQLERFGGSAGVRDRGALESALAVIQSTFDGKLLHGDIFEMAAATRSVMGIISSTKPTDCPAMSEPFLMSPMRLTPKACGVACRVNSSCSRRTSTGALAPASKANAPVLATALTSRWSLIHVMAPQMIGYFTAKNALPRSNSLSNSMSRRTRRSRTRCSINKGSNR
jgi:hypothetical protein